MISVVVPVYKGRNSLSELHERLAETFKSLNESFELLLVNDNCPENSWEVIHSLASRDVRVKGINLSRNFGQHAAITAGLEAASGEWVVVMDCDLQDRPEEITTLYHTAIAEQYEIVFAQRTERQDNFLKRVSSKAFYSVLSYLTDTRQDSTIANFGIYHKNAIRAILSMKDYIRYFPTMAQWVGFRTKAVIVQHSERKHGETSYSWGKLMRLAFNIIISFSDKPLRLTIKLGFLISLISIMMGLFTLYQYVVGEIIVIGYTSLILSIWFLCGLIIMILGMLGLYIGKIFDKVKDRPVFIIRETINVE